jgi:hypothetical protein
VVGVFYLLKDTNNEFKQDSYDCGKLYITKQNPNGLCERAAFWVLKKGGILWGIKVHQ